MRSVRIPCPGNPGRDMTRPRMTRIAPTRFSAMMPIQRSGPETYTGKDMLTAHKGMNISEQEYLAVMDDIVLAMDKNDLNDDAKKDVIAIL